MTLLLKMSWYGDIVYLIEGLAKLSFVLFYINECRLLIIPIS